MPKSLQRQRIAGLDQWSMPPGRSWPLPPNCSATGEKDGQSERKDGYVAGGVFVLEGKQDERRRNVSSLQLKYMGVKLWLTN